MRSAGFQTCCAADFQIGTPQAGLETRDTADLEVCATNQKLNKSGMRSMRAPGSSGKRLAFPLAVCYKQGEAIHQT